MESFLNRYRSITVLLLVIFAQVMLLAVQVKNDQDVRVIRIWTVSAVTPIARVIEAFRGGGLGFVRNYIMLHDVTAENRRLREENGKLKMDNIALRNELNTADRAKALQVFQQRTPSKAVAATVILASAGSDSNVRFLDRGSFSGVQRGMAVVTPDGIVGKIIAAYPSASEMMMVTDPDFAAGVVTQSGVRGTLKGQGNPTICKVDYVPVQEKIAVGDMLYTSGDDRIFPRAFTVGVVKEVRNGAKFKEISVEPAGIRRGVEDVLILVEAVHQEIPSTPPSTQPVYVGPAPPAPSGQAADTQPAPSPAGGTDLDKLRQQYKTVGEQQNHNFGEGTPGSKPPDFTKMSGQPPAVQSPPAQPPPVKPPAGSPAAPPAGKQPGQTPAPTGAAPATPTPARRNNQANGPGGQPLE
jgi:rod shape-determining protein MreC